MSANLYRGGIIGADSIANSGVWGVGDSGMSYGILKVITDFVIIAGGGGGGPGGPAGPFGPFGGGGGGGAGGYLASFGASGGGDSPLPRLELERFTPYPLVVGAGGSNAVANTLPRPNAFNGSNSSFGPLIAIGGGGGGADADRRNGNPGGSGGGGGPSFPGAVNGFGGTGAPGQGFPGGRGANSSNGFNGGGGGAAAAGANGFFNAPTSGTGGAGVDSSITGAPVVRAVGGTTRVGISPGGANTGNGGAGGVANATHTSAYGGVGGSGVIILRIDSRYNATFSPGVSATLDTSIPGTKVYVVTATSTALETVTLS